MIKPMIILIARKLIHRSNQSEFKIILLKVFLIKFTGSCYSNTLLIRSFYGVSILCGTMVLFIYEIKINNTQRKKFLK